MRFSLDPTPDEPLRHPDPPSGRVPFRPPVAHTALPIFQRLVDEGIRVIARGEGFRRRIIRNNELHVIVDNSLDSYHCGRQGLSRSRRSIRPVHFLFPTSPGASWLPCSKPFASIALWPALSVRYGPRHS